MGDMMNSLMAMLGNSEAPEGDAGLQNMLGTGGEVGGNDIQELMKSLSVSENRLEGNDQALTNLLKSIGN